MGKLTGLAKEQRRTLDRLSTVPGLDRLVRYPHSPLDPPEPHPGSMSVAGIRDLSAMKLTAIARRGLRRDFGDCSVTLLRALPTPRTPCPRPAPPSPSPCCSSRAIARRRRPRSLLSPPPRSPLLRPPPSPKLPPRRRRSPPLLRLRPRRSAQRVRFWICSSTGCRQRSSPSRSVRAANAPSP